MKALILLLVLVFTSLQAISQELRRQGQWGMYVVPLSDSLKTVLKLERDAVHIQWLRPDDTEIKAGLQVGDVLLKIDDTPIKSPEDLYFSGILNPYRKGDFITYTVIRGKKEVKIKGEVIPKPFESYPHAEALYDQVDFEGGALRTIITHPKVEGKLPAIYFIPGYNCASYDNMTEIHPYRRMIDSLTALGYAVFRCEKTGMGDCFNTPSCFDSDFNTEQKGFERGYEKLLTYDFIDTSRIFIFGHSLGGINAPLLAEKYHSKGIIVYGTTHLPWMEYLQNMIRFQNPRMGIEPKTMAQDLKLYQSLFYEHYVDKLSPAELVAKNPAYKPLLERDFQYTGDNRILQRDYVFWQQLNDLDLTTVWSNVDSYVLSIYGEADFEAINAESHQDIVRIVNHYHPNKATFYLLPKTNHSMLKVGSMDEGIEIYLSGKTREYMATSFNYDVITLIDEWIKSIP